MLGINFLTDGISSGILLIALPFANLIGNGVSLFSGDDTINGNGSLPQSLYGYGGNDVLTMTDGGLQDADSLYGGDGNDTLQIDFAPNGFNASIGPNDAIFGGAGTDTLWLNMPGSADLSVVPTLPQGIEILRITSEGGGACLI